MVRNIILELLHFALKLEPSLQIDAKPMNATRRIVMLFMELLERQFPIDENHQVVNLRTASEFAEKLNIHVNHLNRAVKENTDKTTTQLISDRVLQEAKILLKQTAWNVSEISYALGFTETTHFNNFFKKHLKKLDSKSVYYDKKADISIYLNIETITIEGHKFHLPVGFVFHAFCGASNML